MNQCSFKHSCRTRPLNDSVWALLPDLPGRVKSVVDGFPNRRPQVRVVHGEDVGRAHPVKGLQEEMPLPQRKRIETSPKLWIAAPARAQFAETSTGYLLVPAESRQVASGTECKRRAGLLHANGASFHHEDGIDRMETTDIQTEGAQPSPLRPALPKSKEYCQRKDAAEIDRRRFSSQPTRVGIVARNARELHGTVAVHVTEFGWSLVEPGSYRAGPSVAAMPSVRISRISESPASLLRNSLWCLCA